MNEPFLVDTTKLRDHLTIIREKQSQCRQMLDELQKASQLVSPMLLGECEDLIRYVEELYRYYREQESILSEISDSYDATHNRVEDLLETATEMVKYAF